MGNFDPTANTPSGLLAHYLFSRPENELFDVELPQKDGFGESEIERLSSLADHRRILKHAFDSAERDLLIVSPTISSAAIEADNVTEMISAAKARGVRVRIFTDAFLDLGEGNALRERSQAGRDMLVRAGAELCVAEGIHNKTIAIDKQELIDGSFNWLSAVRDAKSRFMKEEVSWRYRGPRVPKEIALTEELLTYRMRKDA